MVVGGREMVGNVELFTEASELCAVELAALVAGDGDGFTEAIEHFVA